MTLFGWIWRITILFTVLTIVYLGLTLANRVAHKTQLKNEYKGADSDLSLDDYVTVGMKKYNRSLKAKLILGVYVMPLALIALLTHLAKQ